MGKLRAELASLVKNRMTVERQISDVLERNKELEQSLQSANNVISMFRQELKENSEAEYGREYKIQELTAKVEANIDTEKKVQVLTEENTNLLETLRLMQDSVYNLLKEDGGRTYYMKVPISSPSQVLSREGHEIWNQQIGAIKSKFEELHNKNSIIQKLSSELGITKSKLDESSEKLVNNEKCKIELSVLQDEYLKLSTTLNSMRTDLESKTQQAAKVGVIEQKLALMTKELEITKNQYSSLNSKYNTKVMELDRSTDSLTQRENDINSSNELVKELDSKMKNLQSRYNDVCSDLHLKEKKIFQLTEDINRLNATNSSNEVEITKAAQTVTLLTEQNEDKTTSLSKMGATMAKLTSEHEHALRECNECKTLLNKATKDNYDINEKYIKLVATMDDLVKNVLTANQSLHATQERLSLKTLEIEQKNILMNQMDAHIKKLESDVEKIPSLESEIVTLKDEVRILQEELGTLKHIDGIQTLRSKISTLKIQSATKSSEVAAMESEVQRMRDIIVAESAANEETVTMLEGRLKNKDIDLNRCAYENRRLKTQIEDIMYHYKLNSDAVDCFRNKVMSIKSKRSDAAMLLYGTSETNYLYVLNNPENHIQLRKELIEIIRKHDKSAMELCNKFLKMKSLRIME